MLSTILGRLRGPWVTADPHPTPTSLDRIGCTYPTHAQVRAAVVRGVTPLRGMARGTTLLKPQDVDRVTREVEALFVTEQPVDYWPVTGEHGDIPTIRDSVSVGGAR